MKDFFRALLPYMKRYRREMAIGMIALLVTDAGSVAIPWLLKEFVDLLPKEPSAATLLKYSGLLFAVSVVLAIGRYGWRKYMFGPSRKVEFDILNGLFEHLLTLDRFFFQNRKIGDLISRATNDLRAVRDFVGLALLILVDTTAVMIAAVALMLVIHPMLTLWVLLPLPLVSVIFFVLIREIGRRHQAVQEHLASLTARVQENLAGIRVLHAFAQEEIEKQRFDALNREYIQKNLSVTRLFALLSPSLVFVLGVSAVISIWLGAKAVIAGDMTPGEFVAFNGYLMMLSWPMMSIGYVTNLTQKGKAAMRRIQELFDAKPVVRDGAEPHGSIQGRIEIRNLVFTYPESEAQSLSGIDCTVPAGQSVAIVGKIGSGKSTLAQMLPRLWETQAADSVLIDGKPVRAFPLTRLRQSIGYVDQEPYLFSMSIRDNIALGKKDATDAEIDRVVQHAGLVPDLERFPEGLDTMVGERGVSLSGGQKQRIALARALIKQPRILILDDAFSSLDVETEETILKSIRDTMKTTTTVIITHRLSIAAYVDQILVLDAGSVAERGTHAELLRQNGRYAQMHQNQALAREMEIELQ